MANIYVYSGAAGTGTGADWTNACTTLAAGASAASNGDTIYVADDHSESTAGAVSITEGTASAPSRIICVLRSGGTVPPVAADLRTTAVVATTGANGITLRGNLYIYGIVFNNGTGASAASLFVGNSTSNCVIAEECQFNLVNTASGSTISFGGGTSVFVELKNCSASFGSTSQSISLAGKSQWTNDPGVSPITGATIPTVFASAPSNSYNYGVRWTGLDLSSIGSGQTLIGQGGALTELVNCKLDASVTVAGAISVRSLAGVHVIGSNSTGNVRRDEIYHYNGTLTTETTIKRTAGASDGTTAFSWKIVSGSNLVREYPFETFEGAIWNAATGSALTLTVHTVTDNVTLTDAEIWLEVEYLGSSSYPISTLATDANATILTTAANQATSTETWTTTGLTTPVKQKLEVTFTPQMAGPVRWRVMVAKPSTTVYVCPKAELA